MSSGIAIFAAAALEALLICFFYGYFISRIDRFGSIPSNVMSLSLLCGMASIPLVIIVNKSLSLYLLLPENLLAFNLVRCYFHAGFIEETGKFYLFLLVLYKLKQFRLPVHGIILFSLCGLGFAVVENLYYLIAIGASTAANRASLVEGVIVGGLLRGTPGHILFDAVAGYYFGMAKYKPEQENMFFLKGWAIAVFLHGTFNFIPALAGLMVDWTGTEGFGYLLMVFFYIYILVLIFVTHKVFNEGFRLSTIEVEYHKLTYGQILYMQWLREARIEDMKRFRKLIPLLSLGVIVFFIISIFLMFLVPSLFEILPS